MGIPRVFQRVFIQSFFLKTIFHVNIFHNKRKLIVHLVMVNWMTRVERMKKYRSWFFSMGFVWFPYDWIQVKYLFYFRKPNSDGFS